MFGQVAFAIIGAVLSVVLTRIFIQNGRHIQSLEKAIEEGKKETRQLIEKIADLIVAESKTIKQQFLSKE